MTLGVVAEWFTLSTIYTRIERLPVQIPVNSRPDFRTQYRYDTSTDPWDEIVAMQWRTSGERGCPFTIGPKMPLEQLNKW